MAVKNLPTISLNEIETNDLLKQESWYEIKDRFKELNISLPASLNEKNLKYSDYFLLKSHLTVHSALSRQMEEHSNQRINEYTAQLKDVFQKADETGKSLFEKEDRPLQSLTEDMKPKLQSLEANLDALTKMYDESRNLVTVVTSIQDRTEIQEKTEQRVSEVVPEKHL